MNSQDARKMIPGAFERRARALAAAPIEARGPRAAPHGDTTATAAYDRERLEYEREGGGAPSERSGRRRGTIGGRLWLSVLHPTQLHDIWRRRLHEPA
jgi:hypothetical protein